MTVADLLERLRQLPANSPVLMWDGDNAMFVDVANVSEPTPQASAQSGLPKGSVVLWGG